MKIIALEEHFLSQAVYDANLAVPEPWRDLSMSGYLKQSGALDKLLELGEGRIARMDAMGVDVQVLSLNSPGTQALEPELAVKLAREANDVVAAAVKAHPDRFQGFATLPTPDPKAAADELRRAVQELGLKGAMLNGHTRATYMDDKAQYPIYKAAQELRLPLYVHPQVPTRAVREAYYGGLPAPLDLNVATAGFGWHLETGIQVLRLMATGGFDQFPELQLILGHWGEMLTFYTRRMDSILSRSAGLERPILEVMRNNISVTPSGLFEQEALRYAADVLGIDRVMFSADDPFVPLQAGAAHQFLQDAPLSDADREKVAHGNWERLTGHLG